MGTVTEMGAVLGVAAVCAAVGIARASYYRRGQPKATKASKTSPRSLAEEERAAVLAVLHEPRFADLAPAEVYATSRRGPLSLLRAHDVSRACREQ